MAYSCNIREEEIKNKLRQDYFKEYDSTPILGNIDFAVAVPSDGAQLFETEYLLWAESKKGIQADIYESFVQLILTIGKEKFDSHFMIDYIRGKHHTKSTPTTLFDESEVSTSLPISFSQEAQDVMSAGRKLWRYYHTQPVKDIRDKLKVLAKKIEPKVYEYEFLKNKHS